MGFVVGGVIAHLVVVMSVVARRWDVVEVEAVVDGCAVVVGADIAVVGVVGAMC